MLPMLLNLKRKIKVLDQMGYIWSRLYMLVLNYMYI